MAFDKREPSLGSKPLGCSDTPGSQSHLCCFSGRLRWIVELLLQVPACKTIILSILWVNQENTRYMEGRIDFTT